MKRRRLFSRPVQPLERNQRACGGVEPLVVLQEQFPKLWQRNQRQWHDGAVGFITSLFGEAAGAHVQAPVSGPSSAEERSQFVGSHRAAAVFHLDEYPGFLQAEPVAAGKVRSNKSVRQSSSAVGGMEPVSRHPMATNELALKSSMNAAFFPARTSHVLGCFAIARLCPVARLVERDWSEAAIE